jgi:hypothetical protein
MIPYSSKSGKTSGVTGYKIGRDFILVHFNSTEIYRYSYRSAGRSVVETMKGLAQASMGLSTFISQNQPDYE